MDVVVQPAENGSGSANPKSLNCSRLSKSEDDPNDEPRLMINYIEIINFKSYAGRRILGPFHKRFSCIIGPNGSGKSNVIDSMLFVFGYRAQKIRGQKVSLLIHSSDAHPEVSSCKPSDPNEYEIVEGSAFSISRSAFKAGGSSYAINDKEVQFKEVGNLLRSYGVDLDHNRFLILQGEVEQIAVMKPKATNEQEDGLLEFLEDIIGTNVYKEPLEQLEKQVEELSDSRAEKLNRVRVAETEKNNLLEPMQEAVDFLKLENELFMCQHQILQKNIKEVNSKISSLEVSLSETRAAVAKINQESAGLYDEKTKLSVVAKDLERQMNTYSKKCEELKAKFQLLEKEDLTCREDLLHSSSQAENLKNAMNNNQRKVADLEKMISTTQSEIDLHEKDRQALLSEVQKAEERATAVKEIIARETEDWRISVESYQKSLLEHQGKLNKTKKQLELAVADRDLHLRNKNDAETECKRTENDIKALKESHKTNMSEIESLKRSIPCLEMKTDEIKKSIEKLTNREIEVTEKCQKSRTALSEMKTRMVNARSNNKVHTFLGQQVSDGVISGIYGRLGDLGAVEEKYDVAISTAGGGYLDFIVVDTMETAQRCVELLRANSIGSASFIGLDKQNRWWSHIKKCFNAPENAPRAFDLIKVNNESLLPAFYFAFRDTLVAKDLSQATRVAYGKHRYRVVTLIGQLIEISGTLSGGGKPCKGRMGTQIMACDLTPRKLSASEQSLCKLEKECEETRDQLLSLKRDYEDGVRELRQQQQKLVFCQNEITSYNKRKSELEKYLSETQKLLSKTDVDKNSLAKSNAEVDRCQQAYDEVAAVYEKIQSEIERLNKSIKDHTDVLLSGPKTQLDLVKDKLAQSDCALTKLNVTLKTSQRNLKKALDSIGKSKLEIKKLEEKISSLENRLNALTESGEKLAEQHETAAEDLKVSSNKFAEVKKQIKDVESKIAEIEKGSIELRDKEKRMSKTFKCLETERESMLNKLIGLKLNEIPNCEAISLPNFTPEELDEFDGEAIKRCIKNIQEKLNKMSPNLNAIKDYKLKEEIFLSRMDELNAVTEKRNEAREAHENLRKQRQSEFLDGFRTISYNVKMMYRTLTFGGDAELELVDSLDPFTEGIEFSVRPPKKSWKKISNISGGEKTLSSLSLIFALHMFKPNPLYFMDEIDAALDFRNVSIVANYIKDRTKGAQFVVISLRNNMFELADRLTGIYKTNNMSRSITLSPHHFLRSAKNHLDKLKQRSNTLSSVFNDSVSKDRESFASNGKSSSLLNDSYSKRQSNVVKRVREGENGCTPGKRICTVAARNTDSLNTLHEKDLSLRTDVEMEDLMCANVHAL